MVADVGIKEGIAHPHFRHPAQIHRDGATPSLHQEERRGRGGKEGVISMKNLERYIYIYMFVLLPFQSSLLQSTPPPLPPFPRCRHCTHRHRQGIHALVCPFVSPHGLGLEEPTQGLDVGRGHVQHVVHGRLVAEKEGEWEEGREGRKVR